MKGLSVLVKLQLLAFLVLSVGVAHNFAQQVKQESRYVSTKYKIAFQIPEGSTKLSGSTEEKIEFETNQSGFEVPANLSFEVIAGEDAELIYHSIQNEQSLESFIKGYVEGYTKSGNNLTLTGLQKQIVQIAGVNSLKLSFSSSGFNDSSLKLRTVNFFVPVLEHKRTYMFTAISSDKDFDKWFPVAEKSVNSFALTTSAGIINSFAQRVKKESRYTSKKYKVTFQIPQGSFVQSDATEEDITFQGDASKFGQVSMLNFSVEKDKIVEPLTEKDVEVLAQEFIEGMKAEKPHTVNLLEKRLVQIGGINSLKLAVSFSKLINESETKFRTVAFFIFATKNKRMYVFAVTSLEEDFDKWYPVAEASIKSFALVESGGK